MYQNYLNNGQYYQGQTYQQPNYQQNYIPPYFQAQQPQRQVQELPEMRFGTIDEAKGHMVMPNKMIVFVNRRLNEAYVKSANEIGEPCFRVLKYSDITELSSQPVSSNLDGSNFVKQDDLKGFATVEDIKALESRFEELKNSLEQPKAVE
jgi:hypothetical protein